MFPQILNASSNDLTALPGDFDKMKAAEVLNFSDNIIETLPESICKLASARELDVSNNKSVRVKPCLILVLYVHCFVCPLIRNTDVIDNYADFQNVYIYLYISP